MSSVHIEPQNLPDPAPYNHGKTIAAWVLSVGVSLGFLIGSFGIMIPNHVLTWIGVAVTLISLAAGAAMRALGHGQTLR